VQGNIEMKSRLTIAAATTIGLLIASGSGRANEKLMLRVSPNVSSAPSTVVVTAVVARNAENRSLHIEADSGAFYRSSEVQLEGDKAPVVTEIRLNNLPGGQYTVMAVLRDSAGEKTVVRRTALVLSRFAEPQP
jgi:hypothetical protein